MSDWTVAGFRSNSSGAMYAGVPEQAFRLVLDAGEPEVREPDAAVLVDQDVAGLEIPVQHALVVRCGKSGGEPSRHLGGLVGRQPADPPEQAGEVLALHELHREEREAVHLGDVVHAADVRVGDLPGRAHLAPEPHEPVAVADERLGQELQGHRLSEREVVGPVNLAHAALADQPDNPIAAAEHGSRLEASGQARVAVRRRHRRRGGRPAAYRPRARTRRGTLRGLAAGTSRDDPVSGAGPLADRV